MNNQYSAVSRQEENGQTNNPVKESDLYKNGSEHFRQHVDSLLETINHNIFEFEVDKFIAYISSAFTSLSIAGGALPFLNGFVPTAYAIVGSVIVFLKWCDTFNNFILKDYFANQIRQKNNPETYIIADAIQEDGYNQSSSFDKTKQAMIQLFAEKFFEQLWPEIKPSRLNQKLKTDNNQAYFEIYSEQSIKEFKEKFKSCIPSAGNTVFSDSKYATLDQTLASTQKSLFALLDNYRKLNIYGHSDDRKIKSVFLENLNKVVNIDTSRTINQIENAQYYDSLTWIKHLISGSYVAVAAVSVAVTILSLYATLSILTGIVILSHDFIHALILSSLIFGLFGAIQLTVPMFESVADTFIASLLSGKATVKSNLYNKLNNASALLVSLSISGYNYLFVKFFFSILELDNSILMNNTVLASLAGFPVNFAIEMFGVVSGVVTFIVFFGFYKGIAEDKAFYDEDDFKKFDVYNPITYLILAKNTFLFNITGKNEQARSQSAKRSTLIHWLKSPLDFYNPLITLVTFVVNLLSMMLTPMHPATPISLIINVFPIYMQVPLRVLSSLAISASVVNVFSKLFRPQPESSSTYVRNDNDLIISQADVDYYSKKDVIATVAGLHGRGKLKFLIVTGGVLSSLGKGITASSIGTLLTGSLKVNYLKLDPYINIDPGTMSPNQHGEPFVLDDGSETDLDLGHVERFLDIVTSKANNFTAGQIIAQVINNERQGVYLGSTVQVIPHITNEIIRVIKACSVDNDIVIVEIGGTVGDIESLPFLEAVRQLRDQLGSQSVMFMHVTLVPYINTTAEFKTKPSQHSIRELRSVGINPDIIIARSEIPMQHYERNKIASYTGIDVERVVNLPDVDNIYQVPLVVKNSNLAKIVSEQLSLDYKENDLKEWSKFNNLIKNAKSGIKIALVGKYDLKDAYLSVFEALNHAGYNLGHNLEVNYISGENDELINQVKDYNGVIIPGGFGSRGIEGIINVVEHCRVNNIPCFGICLGMQLIAVEYARNVLNLQSAHSLEINPDTEFPVITLAENIINSSGTLQKGTDKQLGGTMRLGGQNIIVNADTLAYRSYKSTLIRERHRHRYELDKSYFVDQDAFVISGNSEELGLAEIIEISGNSFHLGVQYHPEFLSRPLRPHPLFTSFIQSIIHNLE